MPNGVPSAPCRVDDWVRIHSETRPAAPALSGALEWTYAQLETAVAKAARRFEALGLAPKQRVLLRAQTSPELLLGLLGLWRLGCSAVPIHPGLGASEVWHVLMDCGARHVLHADATDVSGLNFGHHASADAVQQHLLPSAHTLLHSEMSSSHGDTNPLRDSGDGEALVLYTSGTTGSPKGVAFSHTQLIHAERGLQPLRPLFPQDRYLHVAPLHHVAGLECALSVLAAGGCHVFSPLGTALTKTPDQLFQSLRDARASVVFLVPTLLARLLECEHAQRDSLPHLRLLVYGGAPASLDLVERAIDRFASILAQGYGLTEACGAVTWLGTELHAVFDPKIQRSSGTLLPEMTSQVVRLDGTMASGAEPGELWLKGVKVALGEGGWLRTGDLGYFDEHQRWVIVDRLKDIIISGGENVASREVEAVLQLHSDVVEVAVVGVPSPVWGEAVAAFVVLREGVPGDEAHATALIQFAKNQLAGFKAPKHIVWCRDLPRTVAGKIDKKLLRAQPNPDATVLNDH